MMINRSYDRLDLPEEIAIVKPKFTIAVSKDCYIDAYEDTYSHYLVIDSKTIWEERSRYLCLLRNNNGSRVVRKSGFWNALYNQIFFHDRSIAFCKHRWYYNNDKTELVAYSDLGLKIMCEQLHYLLNDPKYKR